MVEIDLDENLIEYIRDKCNRNIEEDVQKIVSIAINEKEIIADKVCIAISAVSKDEIRCLNKEYRNIDKSTDVLSFPIFSREEIDNKEINKINEVELGDIIICIDILESHAQEYDTGILREMLYMITHGVCHLVGYDHEIEEDKVDMRKLEEKILEKIGVGKIND